MNYFIFWLLVSSLLPKMNIFGRNRPFFSLKLAEKHPLLGGTEKSYGRRPRNSGKNWHFWRKWVPARQNYFKQLIPGKIDLKNRLHKSLGLQEVTERIYGRKTKDFSFFRKIDIFGQNRLFYIIRQPENNFFEIKQTKESVRKQGSRSSLKKMVEKPKSFNFFGKNLDANVFRWAPRALKPIDSSAVAFSGLFYLE